MTTMYALIIEDLPLFGFEMAAAVRIIDQYSTHHVASIHRAVDWMNTKAPGSVKLIVLDRNLTQRLMGGVTEGLDGIKALRDHWAVDPAAKIVVWTSQSEPQSIQQSHRAGASAFLSKDRLGDMHDLETDMRTILATQEWIAL